MSKKEDTALLQSHAFPCLTRLACTARLAADLQFQNFPNLEKLTLDKANLKDSVSLPDNLRVTVTGLVEEDDPGSAAVSVIAEHLRKHIRKLCVFDHTEHGDFAVNNVYQELRLAPFASFPTLEKLIIYMVEPAEDIVIVVRDEFRFAKNCPEGI